MAGRVGWSAAIVVMAISLTARAQIINGGFETGNVSSWNLTGLGHAHDYTFGITPPHGLYDGFIQTTGNGTVTAPTVASTLGVPGSAIVGIIPSGDTPTVGSCIWQNVSVNAFDQLTFDWNFITDELDEGSTYNDFAFFTINSSAYLIASRNSIAPASWNMVSPPLGFDGQTGWSTTTYTFPSAGTYKVGFGVLNVFDSGHDSQLLLDGVAVPEPTMAIPLILAAAMLRRRRR